MAWNKEDIHIHVDLEDVNRKLEEIGFRLNEMNSKLDFLLASNENLTEMETVNMLDLTQLLADVSANTDTTNSAIQLLNSISQQLKDANGDPAVVAQIQATLEANTAQLAASIVANTPAAPDDPGTDGGTPPVDGGTPPVDGGTPPADGGTPTGDVPPADAGTPLTTTDAPSADQGQDSATDSGTPLTTTDAAPGVGGPTPGGALDTSAPRQ